MRQNLMTDTELLARLVAFDSTSRNSNHPIADFIADYLDRPGIRIERQPAPEEDKLNLVVSLGPEVDPTTRDGLVLSGHMDVVPAEEPEWQSNPFELTETDDAWVGRGACDMKGFDALAINTMARLASEGRRLAHPLCLLLTYDEELGTLGAHHFTRVWPLDTHPLPRRAIIGEPTSLDVVRMHKGHAKLRLVVRGRSAHSGYPHLGHNAIEPLGRALVALGTLRRELEGESCPNAEHFPTVPFVALNLARLRAGSAINIIPERAELDLGFRVLPGMQAETLRQRIETLLGEVLKDEEWKLELINQSPPMLLAEDHDLTRRLYRVMDQETTVSASYATDAGWLSESGFDCLLWGPGTIEVAHRPNESIPKNELGRASTLLAGVVEQVCGVGVA